MAISLITGLASAIGYGLSLEVFAFSWAYFALGAGLSLVSRALAPKLDMGSQMGGRSVTTREAAHSRKIVYGRARIGGNIVYLESTGTDNKYLWLVIAVAGHEIDAYESVWFNDKKIWDGGSYVGTWGSYVNISFHEGDQTTADSGLVAASTKWTADHKLLDTAYMVVKLTYDADQFAQGLPNISTIVRGKKVLDPSNNSTAWSDNPALCAYDYLRDTKYGLGETAGNILTASVTTAKGICDEPVDLADDTTQARYTINGVLDTGSSIKNNIEQMLGSMIGRLVYSGGQFEIHAGKYVAPAFTVDESVAVGEITVQTKQSRRSAYNGVKGVFLSEDDNYILADYPAQISSSYAAADGDPIYLDMALPFTTNNIRAQRIAKLALFRSRQQEAITIPCNLSALRFKVGENINVTNTRLGYSNKIFEVVGYSMAFSSDGQIVVNVDAIETAASIWDWTTSDEEVFLGGGEVDLYDGTFAAAPTSLVITGDTFINADGAVNASFECTWTDADDAFTDHYVVEWALTATAGNFVANKSYQILTLGDTNFTAIGASSNTIGVIFTATGAGSGTGIAVRSDNYYSQDTKSTPFTIVNLQSLQQYNVRVKAVNEIGVSSLYITSAPIAAIDTTAPSLPTVITATAGLKSISLSWTNPAEKDFNNVEIFRSLSSGGTYAEVSNVAGGFGAKAEHLDGGLDDETAYFYKLKSVDLTGNKTSNTDFNAQTPVSATTLAVSAANVVTTTRITSSSSTDEPTDTVFLDFVGRDPIDGDIVYVTNTSVTPNAQKAYERISGAWVEQTNLISGDVIEDKSISSDNLSSNSVSPSKIIAHATSLVNPVSASGNVYRYGGYDDAGNIVNAIPSGIAVTYDSTENGLSIANLGNSSVRTDSFPIDSNSVYKIKLQIKKTTTGGAWFVGANQYTSFTNGGTSGSNGSTSPIFGRWDINRNTVQGAANVYFAWKSSVTDTNYDEIVCYFLGSDVDINEVPNHLIPSDVSAGPYIQFDSASTHGGLRILNWENGTTNRTLIVKNITVQRMTANSIVAQNIDTTNLAAINADLGTITAGSISVGLLTGDVTEAFPYSIKPSPTITVVGSLGTLADVVIPAPELGLNKRNFCSLDLNFFTSVTSGINTAHRLWSIRVRRKSKGASGISLGDIVAKSTFANGRELIQLAGNKLLLLDQGGSIDQNSDGSNDPSTVMSIYYNATSNRTFIDSANTVSAFSVGDTVYYSMDRFTSAGTYVDVGQSTYMSPVLAPNNLGSYGYHSVSVNRTLGPTTTATEFRLTAQLNFSQTGVVVQFTGAEGMIGSLA